MRVPRSPRMNGDGNTACDHYGEGFHCEAAIKLPRWEMRCYADILANGYRSPRITIGAGATISSSPSPGISVRRLAEVAVLLGLPTLNERPTPQQRRQRSS